MNYRIGEIIKQQRQKLGWDQAELIRQLGNGLTQQTVSSWENGGRPRAALLPKLSEILGVEPEALLEAAGYTEVAANDRSELPARPRITTLPFYGLPPEQFERFTADLAAILYRDAAVHLYGRKGDSQYGIDVEVKRGNNAVAVFQCKQYKQFGKSRVRDVVSATKVKSDKYYLVLSRPASTEARREIMLHQNWELWDAEDLSRIIRDVTQVPKDAAVQLVDTYFPLWREPFLGVAEPGPWATSERFFRPFSGERLYGHDWPLVGRQESLAEAEAFLRDSSQYIAILYGHGGIGKTRFLREVASQAEENLSYQVRFLSATQNTKSADFEKLPHDERLLIVVDDAHDRGDIAEILAGVNQANPTAKIILSLRPYGLSQLAYTLRQVGLYLPELPKWELKELTLEEAERLAGEVAGGAFHRSQFARLANLTKDCPLITVVGAGLVKRERLNLNKLEGDESVRREILQAFEESLVVDTSRGDSRTMDALLKAISILQPLHTDDATFHEALEKLTRVGYDELLPYIRNLEDAGVLARRGRSLRIVPDLLGDAILARACFDERSRISTGYIEKVAQSVNGEPMQHVIINASRVDWQVRVVNAAAPILVTNLWDRIDAELKRSDIMERQQIVRLLQKVAYFQPGRALDMISYVIENPLGSEPVSGLSKKYWPTYGQVIYEVPGVLRAIAYDLRYFPRVADLLWKLVKGYTKRTNQQPEPLRQLCDLAEFDSNKPVIFHEVMIDTAEKWLDDKGLDSLPYSPFDVLEKMLSTEGADNTFDGAAIVFRPYGLKLEAVKPLRDRIINMALREVQTQSARRGVRALAAIAHGLNYPFGLFGRQVTEAERDRWTPFFIETIHALEPIAKDKELDPVIQIALREAIQWHADHSPTATQRAARDVISKLVNDTRHELALVLYDGWGNLLYDRIVEGGYSRADEKKNEHFAQFAKQLTDQYTDDEVVDQLSERLSVQEEALEGKGYSGVFVWTLVETKPSVGTVVCERVKNDPKSKLISILSVVLGRLAATSGSTGSINAMRQLQKLESADVNRAIAHALGWNRGLRDSLLEGELELICDLGKDEDEFVRTHIIRAAEVVDRFDHASAMQILATVNIGASAHVAHEFFSAFGPYGSHFDWADLPDAQRNAARAYLLNCDTLNDHNVTSFLRELAEEQPDFVLTLLKDRVQLSEGEQAPDGYDAIPYWHGEPIFKRPQPANVLRQVRDWMNDKPGSYRRVHDGAEIFKLAAGSLSSKTTLTVLDEFIAVGSKDKLRTVADILRQASNSFMWSNTEFIGRLLGAASQHGQEFLGQISSSLYAAAISGVRSGTPGMPFPEDIAQRDNAATIANKLPPGSPLGEFYRMLERQANESILRHAEDDAKFIDGRDW